MKKNSWAAEELINQGSALSDKNPALSQYLISQGIKQVPCEGIAWFNLGITLHQRKKIPAAIRAYRHALISKNAPFEEAQNNLAHELLLNSQFEEGWNEYEKCTARSKREDFILAERMYGSVWKGLKDKRPCNQLIIISEQGLGDTLQFCRLVPEIKQILGVKTTLFCPENLAPLLRTCKNIGDISLMLGGFDPKIRWCPLMSLPHRLGLNHNNIPSANSYLKPEPERVDKWKKTLRRKPKHLLIALHWQGNPKFEKRLYSKGRSIPFKSWLDLKGIPNIEFISIQKGAGIEQLKNK